MFPWFFSSSNISKTIIRKFIKASRAIACLHKLKAMRVLRVLFAAEQRFRQIRMPRLLFARIYLQVN